MNHLRTTLLKFVLWFYPAKWNSHGERKEILTLVASISIAMNGACCTRYTSPKYHHNRGFGSLKNDKETSSLGEPPFFAAGAPRSDTALVLGHRWPPAAQPPASSAWSAPWRGGFQWRRGVRRCLVAVTTWWGAPKSWHRKTSQVMDEKGIDRPMVTIGHPHFRDHLIFVWRWCKL